MIVKEKTHIKTSNLKQDVGNQVENDVAFYLRRHFPKMRASSFIMIYVLSIKVKSHKCITLLFIKRVYYY